ncbi:MAG: hypothetical protein SStaBPW_06350 [Shewanella algae]
MKDVLIDKLNAYVCQVFSRLDIGEQWSGTANLPVFLQYSYLYREATLLGRDCLLMFDLGDNDEQTSVSSINKHIDILSKSFGGDIIYVVEDIAPYTRKKLVEKKVSFIVPGKQLYLPSFALDFREQFKSRTRSKSAQLGATAQVILLRKIYQNNNKLLSTSELLNDLNVSRMNISRAYNELVSIGLATIVQVGRNKLLSFDSCGRELWNNSLRFLTSPVKRSILVDDIFFDHSNNFDLIKSGECALSTYSMLMNPKRMTYALDTRKWPEIKKSFNIKELDFNYESSTEIELWKYDPRILTNTNVVDPLSLFLSLQNYEDERVEIETENLLNKVWG